MGISIKGRIEVKPGWADYWVDVALLNRLLARDFWGFAALFGVHGVVEGLGPLAPNRGLPPDISDGARADYESSIARFPGEYFGPSWVTWAEIAAIDWHAPVGRLVLHTSINPNIAAPNWWTWWEPAATFPGPFPAGFTGPGNDLLVGQKWEEDDKAYWVVDGARQDLLGADWILVFQLLETLASRYGEDGVHLTVWFNW